MSAGISTCPEPHRNSADLSQCSAAMKHAAQRLQWLDYARAIACLMVVLLHSAAPHVTQLSQIGSLDWWIANTLDGFSRVCVPLFFMISGYLFFQDRAPSFRNLKRIVSALMFYSAIAIAYRWAAHGSNPFAALASMPLKPAFFHLWYFYPLIAIYLIAMMISIRQVEARLAWIIPSVLLVLMNPSLPTVWLDERLPNAFKVSGPFLSYLLLAISGALLGKAMQTRKTSAARMPLILLYVAAASGVVVFTGVMSSARGEFVTEYYGYSNVLVIVGALALFAALSTMKSFGVRAGKVLSHVADHSLCIYGLHAIVLSGLRGFGIQLPGGATVDIFVLFFAALLLSLIASHMLRKIDPKRYVT